MSALRRLVVGPGVGGELRASLLGRPRLRPLREQATHATAAGVRRHEPPFDEPTRPRRVAAVGVRAQTDFDETDEAAAVLRDEKGLGRSTAGVAVDQGDDLLAVLGDRAFGPEGRAQITDGVGVGGAGGTDQHGR